MPLEAIPAKKVFFFLLCIIQVCLASFPSGALSKREHLVHFSNTAYELNIYKIHGKQPGKTLMLIGGIQGNEPGGFLSADLYADMRLEKGNLIVVPRANFYSIILNHRGFHGDMNRKFSQKDISYSMEDKIITILKRLISESDYLLNLHDGAGYYYPKYVDKWRNPMRFGQSVIADCLEYRIPGTGKVIKLGEMAEKVINKVNPYIKNELHRFHFMNTRTDAKESPHREQRMSATYYALTQHHIPAFGVETSKFLPSIHLKVQYHNLIINEFMKLFGITPESPGLVLDPPVLKYLVISVNGRTPIVVKEGQILKLQKDDSIKVTHIEANYERGLSLDILGFGDLNDYRKDFRIFKNTNIIVRKDNHKFAQIPVKVIKKQAGKRRPSGIKNEIKYMVIETGGHRRLLSSGDTFEIVRGDRMKIVDIMPSFSGSHEVKVNFKGFVGDWKNNTGEDRGYYINTATDLMKRYSLHKKGEFYEVVVSQGKNTLGRLILRLIPPRLDYLILKVNGMSHHLLRSDEIISLSVDDNICFEEIQSNFHSKEGIHLQINGHDIKYGKSEKLEVLCPLPRDPMHKVIIKKGALALGRVFFIIKEKK